MRVMNPHGRLEVELNRCFAALKEDNELPSELILDFKRIAQRRMEQVRSGRIPERVVEFWIERLPKLSRFLQHIEENVPIVEPAVNFLDGVAEMPRGSEEDEFIDQLENLSNAYSLGNDLPLVKKFGAKCRQFLASEITGNQLARYAADVFQQAANDRGAKEKFPTTMKALHRYIEAMGLPDE